MLSAERVLLRQHVEAVWGVQLPPLVDDDCELLSTGFQPSWQLYAADVASKRIFIWRPDVSRSEREVSRQRADEVLTFSSPLDPLAGISREVALSFTASSALDLDAAYHLARPLALQDYPLLKLYQPDVPASILDAVKRPLVGAIDSGRLLCLAHSSRRTPEACELGIDTLPTARRMGYALAATVVWTHLILQEGLVPLYSAFAENTASLGLAAKAGYRAFARGATFETGKHQL